MRRTNSGSKNPTAVEQREKYNDLEENLVYQCPELEYHVVPAEAGIESRPPTPSDEPVTTEDGHELVAGTYVRERAAETDAQYRASVAPAVDEAPPSDDEADRAEEAEEAIVETLPHLQTSEGRPAGTYADTKAVEEGQSLGDVVEGDFGELVRAASTGAYWEQVLAEFGVPEPKVEAQEPEEASLKQYMLATEERIRGEHEIEGRARAKAHAAAVVEAVIPEFDRAARCREALRERKPIRQVAPGETAPARTVGHTRSAVEKDTDEGVDRDVGENVDPRAEMDQGTLAAVNQAAARLAKHFESELAIGRAGLSECIARRVGRGADVTGATIAVKEVFERQSTVKQPLASIDPYDQWETTVEVKVETLWPPKNVKQYQVGMVSDESGAHAKLCIWRKSLYGEGAKPTLHEGDRIRAERVKVDSYHTDDGREQVTLAATGETAITVLEQGDGPATRRKVQKDPPRKPSWQADSQEHAWIRDIDMERAIEVTLGRKRQTDG